MMKIFAVMAVVLLAGPLSADVSPRARDFSARGMGLVRSIPLGTHPLGCSVSPDGSLLAVGCTGSQVRVFSTASWNEVRRLTAMDPLAFGVAFSPDGKLLAVGGSQGSVQLIDTTLWTELCGFMPAGPSGPITSLSWSPDGQQLVGACGDKTARVWEARTMKPLWTLRGHAEPITIAAWSPKGDAILTAGVDDTVRLWNARTGEGLRILKGERTEFAGAAFDRGGRRLAAVGTDGSVRVWEVTSGRQMWKALAAPGSTAEVQFAPGGSQLVVVSGDVVSLWRAADGRRLAELKHHVGDIYMLGLSPRAGWIATGGRDFLLKVWQRRPGGMANVKPRGFLGVGTDTVNGRVQVTSVVRDTPAQRAGMQEGDIITGVSGTPVAKREELSSRIGCFFEGDEIEVTVVRDGKELKIRARLAAYPDRRDRDR